MADEALLTKATLVGTAKGIVGDTYDPGFDPDFFNVWCDVTLQPRLTGPAENPYRIRIQNPANPMLVALTPIRARFESGTLRAVRQPPPASETPTAEEVDLQNDTPGVPLLAETAALELPTDVHLVYDVVFGSFSIYGARYTFDAFTFAAPTSDVTVDIARVDRINAAPSTPASAVLRMIPDDVALVEGGIQFYANGVELGDPLPIPGGGGAGVTNLAATLSATQTVITSDTGTDATIPAVNGTNAGMMTPAMKALLDSALQTSPIASVTVTTGSETRPAGATLVFWIGGTTQPTNMAAGDVWLSETP